MSICPGSETLARLLDEKLPSPLRERVETHVEGCAACQQELDLLSRGNPLPLIRLLRRPEIPAHLAARLSLTRIGTWDFRPRPRLRPRHRAVPPPGADWPEIEGYEILGELGSGGMGRAYRARHLGLNRRVALKVIEPGRSGEPRRERLEALARLRHPNIARVYDTGISDGRAFLALEPIGGMTLAAWQTGRPQPPDVAAHLARVLAQAADHAHRNGIPDLGLKPANVLVESAPDGPRHPGANIPASRIKIADFGLADAGDPPAKGTATGRGSEHRDNIGPGADVYGLGAILYELLAGCPPSSGATPPQAPLRAARQAPPSLPPPRPGIPPDLETICMKCLEESPSVRYASAGELAEDLRRFLAREPIMARPTGRPTR